MTSQAGSQSNFFHAHSSGKKSRDVELKRSFSLPMGGQQQDDQSPQKATTVEPDFKTQLLSSLIMDRKRLRQKLKPNGSAIKNAGFERSNTQGGNFFNNVNITNNQNASARCKRIRNLVNKVSDQKSNNHQISSFKESINAAMNSSSEIITNNLETTSRFDTLTKGSRDSKHVSSALGDEPESRPTIDIRCEENNSLSVIGQFPDQHM